MNEFKRCSRCVMDTTAAEIEFDQHNNCNYCCDFKKKLENQMVTVKPIESFIAKVKKDGKGKDYDCIVGVSGGADSSYSLYLAKKHGLRVLAVHMDNGWNSELAANNIKSIVEKLNIDLFTHVIEWEEYKGLMQSFFDADVIDVELLYDNAMLAVNYQLANKYGIKYILSGTNTSTEGMRMPSNWNWCKRDKKNILQLAKRGGAKLNSFPSMGHFNQIYYSKFKRIKWIDFLDYIDYKKSDCMEFLKNEFGFKPYPYKHYESVFTRFYQGYILPNKFKVDKRKLHLSTLIMSGQANRADVLVDLDKMPYFSKSALNEDIEYFLKKMSWSEQDLKDYISRPEISHLKYGSEFPIWESIRNIYINLFTK